MGHVQLAVTAPHATAYDEDYPTRSTENYSHALHDILQDMEDATGVWYLSDRVVTTANADTYSELLHDMVEEVFDYADGAITSYRSTGTPTLATPTWETITNPGTVVYPTWNKILTETYQQSIKMVYFIYYMWKTEEDPLLLKEKLQELLIAWPLLDTTIELNSELGQAFKVYPSWKNADLGE